MMGSMSSVMRFDVIDDDGFVGDGFVGDDGLGSRVLFYNQPTTTSPLASLLPASNICPSGKIRRSRSTTTSASSSPPDILGSGSGNYDHGSVITGGNGNGTGTQLSPSPRSPSSLLDDELTTSEPTQSQTRC